MPRVLVLNNYPLGGLWEEIKRGEAPDHLLFGINYFEPRGYQVQMPPEEGARGYAWLNRLLLRLQFPIPFGDLGQQRAALRLVNQCDLIYSASQHIHLLSYLRALGRLRKPIVCLAHHPLNRGRLARWREPFVRLLVNGTDAFPSLSRAVADTINAVTPACPKSEAIGWGPDQGFYRPAAAPGAGHGIVAAGRTGRDFVTLGQAASQSGVPVRIICLRQNVVPEFADFTANVAVDVQPDRGWMKYRELLEICRGARALAIPLYRQVSLAGLTGLLDALGLGKPVIMTRHPLIDLDIEGEGIGRWVEPGDVTGWQEALRWFDTHPMEAVEMGRRSRSLVDNRINSEKFADRMIDLFDRVLGQ